VWGGGGEEEREGNWGFGEKCGKKEKKLHKGKEWFGFDWVLGLK